MLRKLVQVDLVFELNLVFITLKICRPRMAFIDTEIIIFRSTLYTAHWLVIFSHFSASNSMMCSKIITATNSVIWQYHCVNEQFRLYSPNDSHLWHPELCKSNIRVKEWWFPMSVSTSYLSLYVHSSCSSGASDTKCMVSCGFFLEFNKTALLSSFHACLCSCDGPGHHGEKNLTFCFADSL